MKKLIKSLVLGALVIGMAVGCDKKASKDSSSLISSSSNESSLVSSSDPSSSSSLEPVGPKATSIAIDTTNVKTAYVQGEALDLTGLVVTATFDDGTTKAVEDYETSPAAGTILKNMGNMNIVVAYQNNYQQYYITVSKAPKTAWTEEESALMSKTLYGEVLPYTGFEESTVTYVEDYEAIVVAGGEYNSDTVIAYARALSFNGYVLIDAQSYKFEKSVTTEAGKRFVQVLITTENEQLVIIALDPYYYAFPAGFGPYIANKYFDSKVGIPAIQADYYEVSENENMIGLICYMESETDDAGYSAILTAANWIVKSEKQDGFYRATSPDGAYMISYIYKTDYKAFVIVYVPVDYWNEAAIKAFFAKYNGTYIDVPALELENGQYYFTEYENNQYFYDKGELELVVAFLKIYGGTLQDAKDYMTTLQNAGWKALNKDNSFSAKKAVEGKGMFRIDYSFDPATNMITIIFYIYLEPFPTTEFPQDEIAELLGGYIVDTVPAFVGEAEGFTLNDDVYGTYIVVDVEQGTEEAAIAAYIATLIENGYTKLYEDGSTYVSPNHEIALQMRPDSGSFKIVINRAPYIQWPSTQIAAFLGQNITDTVPVFADEHADEYQFEISDEGALEITVDYFLEEDDEGNEIEIDVETPVEKYIEALLEAGYTELEDKDGDTYYLSKNLQIVIYVEADTVWNQVWFWINTLEAADAEQWPSYHLNYFLNRQGYTDELPIYEGDFVSAEATDGLSALTIDITLETKDFDEIKAEADAYMGLLVSEGFTEFERLGEGDRICVRYKSPNNEYEVSVMYQSFGFTVQIDEIASDYIYTDTFPSAQLFKKHSELENVLPVLVDDNATFMTQIQSDYIEIYAIYEDTSLISNAMAGYAQALKTANFVETDGTDYGYDTIYMSPDGTYYVALTDCSNYDEGDKGFDIEVFYIGL